MGVLKLPPIDVNAKSAQDAETITRGEIARVIRSRSLGPITAVEVVHEGPVRPFEEVAFEQDGATGHYVVHVTVAR